MKKSALAFATILLASTPPAAANAQGWLDRIDNVIDKVDKTIASGERAQNSVGRVMDKIPEGSTQETSTSSDEDEILRRAQEIEEKRILEEAERIRARRGN